MERFTRLDAVACPLPLSSIDTDQLIPARFMKTPRAAGYGGFLLHDLRFGEDGAPRGFVLEETRYAGGRILVARRNFGTGSSREAAVYALWDYGIRCVIAPSFGDIFASNAVKNGLLPAQVSETEAELLLTRLAAADAPVLTVDLEARLISCGPLAITFTVDPVRRLQLLNGWDDIDLTRRHQGEIAAYRAALADEQPWRFPSRS
jgi:3-isopropylmalate/(R)-2-methylmalate dehydratase small subunit